MIGTPDSTIVLASGSPRRTDLLDSWGVQHEICAPLGEECLSGNSSPHHLVESLATAKATEVRDRLAESERFVRSVVLGADTLVHFDGRMLGKPRDAEDAVAMLMTLSGQRIEVLTGVAALFGDQLETGWERSDVVMRPYTEPEARVYVATGEPLDKAGAFAIQGEGRGLVDQVFGSSSNVIGLPRDLVFRLLGKLGWNA